MHGGLFRPYPPPRPNKRSRWLSDNRKEMQRRRLASGRRLRETNAPNLWSDVGCVSQPPGHVWGCVGVGAVDVRSEKRRCNYFEPGLGLRQGREGGGGVTGGHVLIVVMEQGQLPHEVVENNSLYQRWWSFCGNLEFENQPNINHQETCDSSYLLLSLFTHSCIEDAWFRYFIHCQRSLLDFIRTNQEKPDLFYN